MRLFNIGLQEVRATDMEDMCKAMDHRESCVRSADGKASVQMSHDWGCWHHAWANYSGEVKPNH